MQRINVTNDDSTLPLPMLGGYQGFAYAGVSFPICAEHLNEMRTYLQTFVF